MTSLPQPTRTRLGASSSWAGAAVTQIGVLSQILDTLEEARIPYMIVGSFASGFHGEFRATQDADIVIDPTPEQLRAFLARKGGASGPAYSDYARKRLLRARSTSRAASFLANASRLS
jgi:hypothetical protein